jgi:hypothetical protein
MFPPATPTVVPEPAALGLLGSGLGALALANARRSPRQAASPRNDRSKQGAGRTTL